MRVPTRVAVELREGGKSFISVTDDGHGMARVDLALAIERHATSKLPDDDLVHIGFFGFRGEALPSIGAVGRLSIASRARGGRCKAGSSGSKVARRTDPEPTALAGGTRVELRDLFYAVPARLKFSEDRALGTECGGRDPGAPRHGASGCRRCA